MLEDVLNKRLIARRGWLRGGKKGERGERMMEEGEKKHTRESQRIGTFRKKGWNYKR